MSDLPQNPGEWQQLLEQDRPWYRTLGDNLQAFLAPPVVFITSSKPVKVADMWAGGASVGQLRRNELMSALAHALVLALLTLPFMNGALDPRTNGAGTVLSPFDVGKYELTYPRRAGPKPGGGGGGGERNPLAASRGHLPKSSLEIQLTPPAVVTRNPNPRLTAEPTVVVPPEVILKSPDVPAYGDPKSSALLPSGGPGHPAGIGPGSGRGVGPGDGDGVGPGEKYGTGGRQPVYRPGGNVSSPVCVYCPQPEFSDEARKARHQGRVLLWAVVDEQGRVRDIRVQQSLGMGLDEEAVRTVQNWRFTPAERLGKPVPVMMSIQVDFHLY